MAGDAGDVVVFGRVEGRALRGRFFGNPELSGAICSSEQARKSDISKKPTLERGRGGGVSQGRVVLTLRISCGGDSGPEPSNYPNDCWQTARIPLAAKSPTAFMRWLGRLRMVKRLCLTRMELVGGHLFTV